MAHRTDSTSAPAQVASPSWRSIWVQTVARRPSLATFETLARDPEARSTKAYLWIFVSSLISLVFFAVGLVLSNGWPGSWRSLLLLLLVEVPIGTLLSVLTFMLSTGVTQLMAKAIRGTGTYRKLAYSIAAFSAPLALIFSASSALVMNVFGRIASPTVASFLLLPLVLLFGIYGFVLSVIAVRTVNQLEWVKAIVASISGVFALVIGAVLSVGIAVLLILVYPYIFRWYLLSIFVLLPIIPLCIVAFISAIRWRKLRPSVDSTNKALVRPEKKESELASQLLVFEIWEERFQRAFYNSLKELRQSEDKVEQAIAEDLNELYAQAGELLAKKTYDLALGVLETGELQSMLVKIDNVLVYILFFPGLHDQPSLLKRYKSFSKGWVSHIEQMRTLLPSETKQFALAELALFLTPNLRQGVMYLAFQDKEHQLLPAGLLDDPEVKNAQGRLCGLRQVF